ALDMELDGERYYRKQAETYADTPLKRVFDTLARGEAKHADIIRGRMGDTAYELKASELLADRKNLFSGMEDYQPLVKANPAQATLYHEALTLEQKSIDLYTDLRSKATDSQTIEMLDFLIQEETRHAEILEEVFRFVNRPNEWVESAEFGLREEY
ncbi:MAG TPA: ferritin family protein, partial [Candidatus Limiplasma sp.]|nr:ferritin family protein [Candidatus Limiplasma sp.]